MCVYIYIYSHIFGKRLNNPAFASRARFRDSACLLKLCSGSCEPPPPHCRTILQFSSNFRKGGEGGGGEGAVKSAERRNTTPQKYSRIVVNFIIMKLCASSCLCERDIESKHRERFYMVLGRSLRSHNRGGKLFDCRLKLHSPPRGDELRLQLHSLSVIARPVRNVKTIKNIRLLLRISPREAKDDRATVTFHLAPSSSSVSTRARATRGFWVASNQWWPNVIFPCEMISQVFNPDWRINVGNKFIKTRLIPSSRN